jgi:hypothetical protein
MEATFDLTVLLPDRVHPLLASQLVLHIPNHLPQDRASPDAWHFHAEVNIVHRTQTCQSTINHHFTHLCTSQTKSICPIELDII